MRMRPRIKRSKVCSKPKCHEENSNLNGSNNTTEDIPEIPDFSEKSENINVLTLEGIEKLLDKKFEVFEKRFEEKNGELAKSVTNNVKSSMKKMKKSIQIIHTEKKEIIKPPDQNEQKDVIIKEMNKNQKEVNKKQKEIIEEINKNQKEIIKEINKNQKEQNEIIEEINKNQKEIIEKINKNQKEQKGSIDDEINKNQKEIIAQINKNQTELKEIIEKKSKNILDNCKINQHQIEIIEVNSNNILDKCIGKF